MEYNIFGGGFMPQIIPIRDLRDTTKLSEMCNATNEPIYEIGRAHV